MADMVRKAGWTTVCLSMFMLAGCAALSTSISNRNLSVKTQMSNSIFLNPIADNQKIIYMQVRNTSDEQSISVQPQLIAALQAKGYQITTDPGKAFEMLQVNILQAGQTTNQDLDKSLLTGFGTGIITGAAIGSLSDSSQAGIIAGAAVGIGSLVADALVKNVTYSVTTDVQVSVRLPAGSTVTQNTSSNLSQGSSTQVTTSYQNKVQWQQYRTRVISYANKVNLAFSEAEPQLSSALAQSIANIF
ncbi:MAG: complement resistance protein TraT [Gammaproteobacteria bacterium]|jgi:hypothetical protein|nr:complement resistance protein TraT [Gammaproteobacteria bacterium]